MTHSLVTLADAQPQDAQALRELMARVIAVSVTQDEAVLQSTIANVNRNLGWWLAHPGECVHLKAEAGGRIVGVVLVKQFWNLCSLFVEADLQGQGVGRALVEAACDACRGRSPESALFLNAATNAIPFYRHLGFVERESAQTLPAGFLPMRKSL
ncbi:GNAT family N-acetyltransferase [Caenimonas koreensis DSM 17982]|uniref:GNAT family N-acetyltransferase n=1 Tax=Caenimonas koreensis DSM 17982 TaxID=1121255 RepID=A0A844B901_9BURK|nr:GNAT family N-acetyltransferase [Caenimonas koreensis]MRD48079.1 GNAT family N-acetyltransferase [Caenimonas koreensis DSM 17982]